MALVGACVEPVADATKRLAEPDGLAASAAPDLDGDGTPDIAVPAGMGVITHTFLYVQRGACGHFVGDVGGPPQARATRTQGMSDLVVPEVSNCEGARCGCEPGEHHFLFDGTTYKLDEAHSKQSVEKPCAD